MIGVMMEQEQPLYPFQATSVQSQAAAAGFATVELYVQELLDRDANRLAIKKGIEALEAGQHRPFDDFDREFCEKNGLATCPECSTSGLPNPPKSIFSS